MTMTDTAAELTKQGSVGDARFRDVLFAALALSTGAVDAISWLTFGRVFSAFMTGNLAFLGFAIGGAQDLPAGRAGMALLAFAVGAILGARIVRPTQGNGATWPRRVTLALLVTELAEGVFLLGWLLAHGHPTESLAVPLICTSALAMGIQTVAISSLGVRGVFTTAATATIAFLFGDLAGRSQAKQERLRLLGVVSALMVGASIGAALLSHAPLWAPVFPLCVTAMVVTSATSWFRIPNERTGELEKTSPFTHGTRRSSVAPVVTER